MYGSVSHKHLCMVLSLYSKIQVLPGITSCRLMKDNKPAVDLNDLLKKTYAKDVIEKWLNSDYDRYNLDNFE